MKGNLAKAIAILLALVCFAACSSTHGEKTKGETGDTLSAEKVAGIADPTDKTVDTKAQTRTAQDTSKTDKTDNNVTKSTSSSKPIANSTQTTDNEPVESENVPSSGDDPKLPTSNKKVIFSKNRLKNELVPPREEPKLVLVEMMTKDEVFHYINGTIPPEIQYLFDWYFAVYDENGPETIVCPQDEFQLFRKKTRDGMIPVCEVSARTAENDMVIATTSYERISKALDEYYDAYQRSVKTENEDRKDSYYYAVSAYNDDLAWAEETCELVKNAVVKAGIQNGDNEVAAITKIIDYISAICSYWHGIDDENFRGEGTSLTDCLEGKKAVCDGYAKAFYAMGVYCGLDVSYYIGRTDTGEGHVWNSVKVNGREYYFDITWYDVQLEDGNQSFQHIWCSEAVFSKQHIPETSTIVFW